MSRFEISSFYKFAPFVPPFSLNRQKESPETLVFPGIPEFRSMRKMGLEPTRHECHKILSLARLPVPTLPHSLLAVIFTARC